MLDQLLAELVAILPQFEKDFPDVDGKIITPGLGDGEMILTRWVVKGAHSRYAHLKIHSNFQAELSVGRRSDAYSDGVEFSSTIWIRSESELRHAAAVMYHWASL